MADPAVAADRVLIPGAGANIGERGGGDSLSFDLFVTRLLRLLDETLF